MFLCGIALYVFSYFPLKRLSNELSQLCMYLSLSYWPCVEWIACGGLLRLFNAAGLDWRVRVRVSRSCCQTCQKLSMTPKQLLFTVLFLCQPSIEVPSTWIRY